MTEYIFILSLLIVLGCLGVSLKPSPIYGGFCLVVAGCASCLIILAIGGSFLGFIVFLVYLGGILVVFGYTAAISTEEYPETLMSNRTLAMLILVGLLLEGMAILVVGQYNVAELGGGLDDTGG